MVKDPRITQWTRHGMHALRPGSHIYITQAQLKRRSQPQLADGRIRSTQFHAVPICTPQSLMVRAQHRIIADIRAPCEGVISSQAGSKAHPQQLLTKQRLRVACGEPASGTCLVFPRNGVPARNQLHGTGCRGQFRWPSNPWSCFRRILWDRMRVA
ncbi:uncharacterized protein M421DRAFT_171324 [Didymella exigua CBS 183.55]|uniref:Uncharacterized protein n=1 Tax=Didymella exigua CBS 183.55 TaxID=1150837 RepID=A0A6A5RIH0_9PLEO|nr:uncharacterized protein M421DRAFT_171324 [Didymella exigua CBS 183.55]KAF1927612.1 hypothetical protein M421DRAFT_171324 [Didymella exigua CBS 183.55]